jgi:hypothetical protein
MRRTDSPDDEAFEASSALMAGRRIGAYHIVRQIERGGMGAVYLGHPR